MFRRFALVSCCLFIAVFSATAQRPKIGLALSGGGAKGLVHIGILQAIDSAGLKVDYIAGTSMGSIVGGMYAIGYNADTIETIARNLDWTQLLTNKSTLETTPIENKNEYGRYLISLPVDKHGVKVRGGVIESQELWLKFHEIFQPAYGITDFKKLSIPFMCVATDLQTGKPVFLSEGDLVQSIRASMALPSIFTPVTYKNTKLIDGGVVVNFPVSEVIKMGADYVIGVSVSDGLEKLDKLNTPVDVLQQVAFFKDADNFRLQRKRTNLYIQPDLGDFTGGSFASADSIISIGIAEGKKYYPIFKRLADSLNAQVPVEKLTNRLVKKDSILISGIDIKGLRRTSNNYFAKRLNIDTLGKVYTIKELNAVIRNMYATDYYGRITYILEPDGEAARSVKLKITADENPMTFIKMGLHYATYSKVAVIANLLKNSFIRPGTVGSLKVNISENFRAMAQTHSYLDRYNTNAIKLSLYAERIKRPRYEDYRMAEIFTNFFSQVGADYYRYFPNRWLVTGGGAFMLESFDESVSLKDYNKAGLISYFTLRGGLGYHTLDKVVFPKKGAKIEVQGSIIFGQQANDAYGQQIYTYLATADSVFRNNRPYERLLAKAEKYTSLSPRFTLINKLQFGANFNYDKLYGNAFLLGGSMDYNRNQITFAGFRDAMIPTSSVAVADVGMRFDLGKSIVAMTEFSTGISNFLPTRNDTSARNKYLSGTTVTLGYDSAVLPIQLSFLYSPQTGRTLGNINIGYHF